MFLFSPSGTALALTYGKNTQYGGLTMRHKVDKSKSVIDPVCGMAVSPKLMEIVATIQGQTYYFCAEGCRKAFLKEPQKFLESKQEKHTGLWCRYMERLQKATGGRSIKCH